MRELPNWEASKSSQLACARRADQQSEERHTCLDDVPCRHVVLGVWTVAVSLLNYKFKIICSNFGCFAGRGGRGQRSTQGEEGRPAPRSPKIHNLSRKLQVSERCFSLTKALINITLKYLGKKLLWCPCRAVTLCQFKHEFERSTIANYQSPQTAGTAWIWRACWVERVSWYSTGAWSNVSPGRGTAEPANRNTAGTIQLPNWLRFPGSHGLFYAQ